MRVRHGCRYIPSMILLADQGHLGETVRELIVMTEATMPGGKTKTQGHVWRYP